MDPPPTVTYRYHQIFFLSSVSRGNPRTVQTSYKYYPLAGIYIGASVAVGKYELNLSRLEAGKPVNSNLGSETSLPVYVPLLPPAVCLKGHVAGADTIETGNKFSQLKF